MADALKNQIYQAKNRARELLDLNNSARSATSDKLFSVLEAGEGSFISRDQIDQFLHNYLEGRVAPGILTTMGYDRAKLRQDLSIKDKIAYITANIVGHLDGRGRNSTGNFNDSAVREELNKTISHLETKLLKNKDFTESRILRNSALNRFEAGLETPEKIELNNLASNLKKFCTDNGLDTLANITDFTNESDSQKIWKMSEVFSQLSARGISPDEKIVKGFERFNEKLKPLKDLDLYYRHMTKTLNMIHRVAQKGYHSMVTPNQKAKVEKILDTLGERDNVNKSLVEYNNVENFKNNTEHTHIENSLDNIQNNPKYEEILLANGISKAEFNERFISLSTFLVTEQCKKGLDEQKQKAFGNRTPDFKKDVQAQRGIVRARIFEIADRMTGIPADFPANIGNPNTSDDFDTANSYFEKFKDLFFAKEEDNYTDGPASHREQYNRMEKVVSAIIRRRMGALVSGNRIRRGSAGRIMLKFLEHALKGKDRGLYARIRRMRHDARDDAEVIAIIIMAQTEATNQMFYQDRAKTKEPDRRYGKLFNKIKFTEYGREGIRDAIAPAANKALQLTEMATKKGLQLASGTAKVANTVASKGVRGVTRATGGLSGRFNGMIEKNGYKRWKTPLYLPYLITKPIQQGSNLLNQGATWTDKNLNGEIRKIDNKVGQGYEESKKFVAEATGEETQYLFQGLTRATEQVTSFMGKTISAGGKIMHDAYTTGQQRSILGAFYAAAADQKGLEDLMQSSDLGNILNLEERGPSLFDYDGRVLMIDQEQAKEKNDLEPKVEDIKNQIKEYESEFKNRQDSLEDKLDTFDLDSPEYANTKKELDRLTLILDTIGENQTDINDVIKKLEDLVNNRIVAVAPQTVEDVFLQEITNAINTLKQRKTDGKTALDTAKTDLQTTEQELEQKKNELGKIQKTLEGFSENDKSFTDLTDERNTISDSLKTKKEEIIRIKGTIDRLSTKKELLNKQNEYLEQEKKAIDELKRKEEEKLQKLQDSKTKINNLINEKDIKETEVNNKQEEIDNKQTEINNKQEEINNKQIEIDNKQEEINNKQIEINDKQEEINNFNGDPKEKHKLKKEKNGLELERNTFKSEKNKLEGDKNKSENEKRKLENDKKELENEKRKLNISVSTANADERRTKGDFFLGQDNLNEQITAIETKITTLTTDRQAKIDQIKANDIAILGTKTSKKDQLILSIQGEIGELDLKLKGIDKKLESKSPQAKSRVETKQDEDTCKEEISNLEKQKNKLNKDILTQTEKNRIYDKASRRGDKFEKLANELIDINGLGVSDEEKKKMKNKLLKEADLDFDKKSNKKIDLSSLSEDAAKQLLEELNKKYGTIA